MRPVKTEITLPFADGEYLFRLPVKRICEIEEKAGPIDGVRHRLTYGGFSINDVVETIRQALIGGGTSPLRANDLIDRYVDGMPVAPSHMIARTIISALYVGYEPESGQKKSEAEDPESPDESTGDSSSTTAEPSG